MNGRASAPLGHLNEMVAKVGFDWPLHFVNFGGKDNGVELRHHLPFGEGAEIAPTLPGGALGMRFGELAEVGPLFDLSFQGVAVVFRSNENVTC